MRNEPGTVCATTANLTPELIKVGLQQLTQARAASMAVVSDELKKSLPAWQASKETGKAAQDVPEWVQTMDREASMPDGSTCWKTVQTHIARRTAQHLSAATMSEQVTGKSLASFLDIDLEAFALEGWASVTQVGADIAKERGHV